MIYPSISYINSQGEEFILSMKGDRRWWEMYGRFGFGAPAVKTEDREYANGSVRTLAAILQPRECGIQMVVLGDSNKQRDEYFFDMVSHLVQTGSKEDWGKLKIRRSDGTDVYLNCIYSGGVEELQEAYWAFHMFTLNFRAGDPYFYDLNETVLRSEELAQPIRLKTGLFLGKWRLNSGITDITIDNTGEILYPVIEVMGPVSNIRITNMATGKTLAMNSAFSLTSGQTLTLDCRENRRGITLTSGGSTSDISNQLALGSSLIWPIVKGTNKLSLYYTASGNTSGYNIRYQKRYLSA